LYSLTDDELKLKATEIKELERMDIRRFFQYYVIFENKLDTKLNRLKNG